MQVRNSFLEILYQLLTLRSEGANPFSAEWFWYDSYSSTDGPNDTYYFFVVDVERNKIVRESVGFHDSHGNGFDPALFIGGDYSHLDRKQRMWQEAATRFWYRKFYTETYAGQVRVLCKQPKLSDRWKLLSSGFNSLVVGGCWAALLIFLGVNLDKKPWWSWFVAAIAFGVIWNFAKAGIAKSVADRMGLGDPEELLKRHHLTTP